jgi:hypothetical protein
LPLRFPSCLQNPGKFISSISVAGSHLPLSSPAKKDATTVVKSPDSKGKGKAKTPAEDVSMEEEEEEDEDEDDEEGDEEMEEVRISLTSQSH